MTRKTYFENLDTLRFLCFFMVFLFHSFHTEFDYILNSKIYYLISRVLFRNGNMGVNFFFVLSGFLITYLLIEEKKTTGHINLKNFWVRRILRIWPLYYCCVFFGFFVFPYLKSLFGQPSHETATLTWYLTFLNNFDAIRNGPPDASTLFVLWSIAIEEQFYLVWPLLLYFLPTKRYWIVFATIVVGSWVFRAYYDTFDYHEYHTLSCIGDMAIGAFGAWLVLQSEFWKNKIIHMPRWLIACLYLIFLGVYFGREELLYNHYHTRIFERSIIAFIALSIILEQNYAQNSFFKLGKLKSLSQLGVVSYGLYCLHFIGILIALRITTLLQINTHLWQVVFIDTSLALGFTILLAQLSYRYFESYFLRLKEKFL